MHGEREPGANIASGDVRARARATGGSSCADIYQAALTLLDAVGARGRLVVDVGCGKASFRPYLADRFERYVGADAIAHEGLPSDVNLVEVNLETGRVALGDGSCDAVVCLETIEHVENPRALVRELRRLARPGGWVLVTTPNQLSLASKLSLLTRNQFVAFQERPGLYPAHITALLEIDLVRIFTEVGLTDCRIRYTGKGRIPLSARKWPAPLTAGSGVLGRAFSDNVLAIARRPETRS